MFIACLQKSSLIISALGRGGPGRPDSPCEYFCRSNGYQARLYVSAQNRMPGGERVLASYKPFSDAWPIETVRPRLQLRFIATGLTAATALRETL